MYRPLQMKADRKQTTVKLTASKQCIQRSAFGKLPLPHGYLFLTLVIIKDYRDAFDDLGKGNNINCLLALTCLLNHKKMCYQYITQF